MDLNEPGIVFFDMNEHAIEHFNYPSFCSVKTPDHKARHFFTMANAERVIQVIGNRAVIVKGRTERNGTEFTISDEDLVILKLKYQPFD